MRRTLALALLGATSCGMGAAAPTTDGGFCELVLGVLTADPVVGEPVIVRSTITGDFGVIDVSWSVTDPSGLPVSFTERNPDGTEIELVPELSGPYGVTAVASAWDVSPCSDVDTINVRPVSAPMASFTLRFVPPAGASLPPPQQAGTPFVVYSGASWNLGTIRMLDGKSVSGTLTGPSGPLAAYLSLRGETGFATEFFAGTTGAYTARLVNAALHPYDVIVVPYDQTVAPARIALADDAALAAGIVLDGGEPVTGRVVDPGDVGVAGAVVAIGAPGVPAAIAVTAPDGSFATATRGGVVSILVTPPSSSSLPRLELPASAGLAPAAGDFLEIRWNAAPVATFAAAAETSTGAPVPRARVTFVGESAPLAGTITIGAAVHDLPSSPRYVLAADDGGQLASISLPHGRYDVIVEAPPGDSSGEGAGISALDLGAGPPVMPPVFATSALVGRAIAVQGVGGLPVPGATISAVASGYLGVGGGAAVVRITDETGTATLPVVATMGYSLLVTPPRDAGVALGRVSSTSGSGTLTVRLAAALHADGVLEYPSGGGAAGVRVEAYCVDCPDGASPLPVAETTTGAGGVFRLALPDPGR